MHTDSGMTGLSLSGYMPYMTVASLEMSDEPDFLQPAFLSFHNLLIINIIYNIYNKYNNSIMIKKKRWCRNTTVIVMLFSKRLISSTLQKYNCNGNNEILGKRGWKGCGKRGLWSGKTVKRRWQRASIFTARMVFENIEIDGFLDFCWICVT